jgi:thiol:disulfide interchange protein
MIRSLLRSAAIALTLVIVMTLSAFAAEKIFDPTRDSAKDLIAAEAQATAGHKRILLDVGGEWCSWCHLLDRTLHENASLKSALDKNYVVVHVNWSRENENQAFLSRFPKANGFPYLLVLSASGKLLHAQPTDVLEADHKLDSGYNEPVILDFLNQWAPGK